MVLLLDIGNTHTHFAFARGEALRGAGEFPTALWRHGIPDAIRSAKAVDGVALCSVVPPATRRALRSLRRQWKVPVFELTHATAAGIGIDYPKPETIGPDRLANAMAAQHRFGAPVVVVDFGTAVTFDVVNGRGKYVGGIIAPGLAAMTDYLHDRTALLPRIRIRETRAVIGKSTEQAMLVGAVHGYRGLIHQLIQELKSALKTKGLPVVATGGCARLMASKLPEITAVDPLLTLKGLQLAWAFHGKRATGPPPRPAHTGPNIGSGPNGIG